MVNGNELCAVGEGSFDLHLCDHFGDAGHDLPAAEEAAAEVHQLGDAAAIANELQDLRGDEGDAFGVIQAHAAGQALLCQETGVVQHELFDLAGGQVHLGELQVSLKAK